MSNPVANTDTIVAVSSAAGVAHRAIIRMSGPEAVGCAEVVFRPSAAQNQNPESEIQNHAAPPPDDWSVTVGSLSVSSLSAPVPCLLYLMRAPRSYTREDVVEFHVVGSPPVTAAVLAEVLSRGVRLARPGEFTERAYLNGRMDLSQAEAVLKIIQATSDAERRLALGELTGKLSKRITVLTERLVDLLARVELALDFSEEDVPVIDAKTLGWELASAAKDVDDLLSSGDAGYVYAENPRVSIIGRTNVGKSSLFNRLLGSDEAIVTSISGTTRDVLEQELDIAGTKLLLVDTAGEKESPEVEGRRPREEADPDEMAIERARAEREKADLLLLVIDGSQPLTAIDVELLDGVSSNPRPLLLVLNKTDLPVDAETDRAARCRALVVPVSCATGQGIGRLRDEIRASLSLRGVERSGLRFMLNLRQLDSLRLAAESLRGAQSAAAGGLGLEFAAADILAAINRLRELTHPLEEDEILDRIFSRFCIGK
jgi:tRNA modification GTPase